MLSVLMLLCRVKLTEDGKKALLKLSKGDMRRALNVLQACHAAYDRSGEAEIYNCTGNPHPSDIETIVNSMLQDDFTTSYNRESDSCLRKTPVVDLLAGSYISTKDGAGPRPPGPHQRRVRISSDHPIQTQRTHIPPRLSCDD